MRSPFSFLLVNYVQSSNFGWRVRRKNSMYKKVTLGLSNFLYESIIRHFDSKLRILKFQTRESRREVTTF